MGEALASGELSALADVGSRFSMRVAVGWVYPGEPNPERSEKRER